MPEPEKPELEAVAWILDWGRSVEVTNKRTRAARYDGTGDCIVTPLCSLPAAQALLKERDELIGKLEDRIAGLLAKRPERPDDRSLGEIISGWDER